MSSSALKSAMFRTDASLRIATGHVMRCLTLADALKTSGFNTFFICRALPGNLFDMIQQRGHQLLALSAPDNYLNGRINHNDYAINLGVPWKEDAQETSNIIRSSGVKPDWLIIDHYALDRHWDLQLRCSANKILVIDDIAEKPHECDLLLNVSFLSNIEESYKVLVPKDTRLLLGPKYVLLRPEFREARKKMKPRDGIVRRVLVFYGGVDPTNETGKALEAIVHLNRPDIHVDVVIGSANPHREIVQSKIEQLPNATLHIQLPHLAHLVGQADLALGAGGSTILELLFLGVPTLVTTTADNQVPNIRYLHENGLVSWLGAAQDVGVIRVKDALQEMLVQAELLRRLSEAGREIIDGQGIERLTRELESSISDSTLISPYVSGGRGSVHPMSQ